MVKRTDFMPSEENLKGPTIAEVLAATKHVPLSRTSQATANFNVGMLQSDVICLTLLRICRLIIIETTPLVTAGSSENTNFSSTCIGFRDRLRNLCGEVDCTVQPKADQSSPASGPIDRYLAGDGFLVGQNSSSNGNHQVCFVQSVDGIV